MRGWTQQQAAEQLEPFLGERWSKATFSAAERSIDGNRIRQFTADDLYAFSRAFAVPIAYFLRPPAWAEEVGHGDSSEAVSAWDFLDMVFDVGSDATGWLLREAVPMTRHTTLALRRWGQNFADMVAHREREVESLIATALPNENSPGPQEGGDA